MSGSRSWKKDSLDVQGLHQEVESAQNVEWSCNSAADVCFLFSRFGPIPASELSAMQWQAEANMHYIRLSAVHIYGACCK